MPKSRNADRRAAAAAAELRGEREQATMINNAIAATETEIFDEAMGDEPLDLDGDRSLEAMADDIGDEDEVLEDEEATDAEVDTEVDEGGEEEIDDEDEDLDDEPAQRGRGEQDERDQRGRVPAGRHREVTRERDELRYDISTMQARINDLVTLVGQRPAAAAAQEQEQAETPPDMFSDPDGFREYLVKEATKAASQAADQRVGTFSQQQRQTEMDRVEASMQEAAAGPRRFEFHEAYRQLTALEKNAQSARLVREITASRDPAAALLDWFEDNGAEEFRAGVAEALGFEVEQPASRRGRDDRGDRGERPAPRRQREREYDERYDEPRHEVRLPRSLRRQPPSLNDARGASRVQRDQDPRGFDGSDTAIFDYAAR